MQSQMEDLTTSSTEEMDMVQPEFPKEEIFREEVNAWIDVNAMKLFQLEVSRFLAREKKRQTLSQRQK